MADLKISELADGAPAQAADMLAIARSGANYRVAVLDVLRQPVLYSQAGLSLSTTGTIEEVLKTVTIPGGTLNGGLYAGFSVFATLRAAANTHAKTPRFRVGGLAGTIVAIFSGDAVSDNRYQFNAVFAVQDGSSLDGQCSGSRVSGSSFLFGTTALTGLNFANDLDITITGETPSAAGELTLTSMRVTLTPAL